MSGRPLLKVCGLCDARQAVALADQGVDLLGFVFHPASPRYAMDRLDAGPLRALAQRADAPERVGVFVNEKSERIREVAERFGLSMVQLHGKEDPAFCAALAKDIPVIKAFRVETHFSNNAVEAYTGTCSYYLFDAQGPLPGGNGTRFNKALLNRYAGTTPFLLAGGIGLGDAQELRSFRHTAFAGVDVNSRFETAPGTKDLGAVEQFMKQYKHGEHTVLTAHG